MKNPAGQERGSQERLPTVAEICEHHIASRHEARTASTYRSRLRPLTRRYGTLAAAEALRRLIEIERELAVDVGQQRSHKAITLLLAAARDAGLELLGLVEAAREVHVAVPSLRALADEGRLRIRYRRGHGRGESILFDRDELIHDLDALEPCLAPDCEHPGTGSSGYCGEHYGQGGRARAREAEEDLLARRRDWLTVEETARLTGAAQTTVRRWLEQGWLPSEKVGRNRRIPRAAVREFRESREGAESPRPARPRSPELVARNQRLAMLYDEGKSIREVAAACDLSPTQARRVLGALRVEIRPKRREPKYPPPDERHCQGCGKPFTPPFPSSDVRVDGPQRRRFCSDECARDWRSAQRGPALTHRGLLDTRQVAAETGHDEHTVISWIARGLLATELVSFPGMIRPVHGIQPAELKRFLRAWALEGDGRRLAALDPSHGIARAERDGRIDRMIAEGDLTRADAYDVIRGRLTRRRAILAQRRKGPRPATTHTARDLRWGERMLELQEERAYHKEQLELKIIDKHDGERYDEAEAWDGRSDYSLAKEVAARDWREHPEDWPRDKWWAADGELRSDMLRRAGELVLKATNRLQTARI